MLSYLAHPANAYCLGGASRGTARPLPGFSRPGPIVPTGQVRSHQGKREAGTNFVDLSSEWIITKESSFPLPPGPPPMRPEALGEGYYSHQHGKDCVRRRRHTHISDEPDFLTLRVASTRWDGEEDAEKRRLPAWVCLSI